MMIRRSGVRQRDLPSPFQEVGKRFGVADYHIACEAKRLQRSLGNDLVTVVAGWIEGVAKLGASTASLMRTHYCGLLRSRSERAIVRLMGFSERACA
jgi:hypothetical protein